MKALFTTSSLLCVAAGGGSRIRQEALATMAASASNLVLDDVGNLVNEFDFERENIRGVFTNLTLLSMVLVSLTRNRKILQSKKSFKEEYDYVIVGGGTGGSVMANRLSQKPCVSVLLLEAGAVPPITTEIPAYARLFHGSDIDWAYRSTPQKYSAFGQKDNRVVLNNGKALGGSSTINGMLYVRGNMRNYDEWEREGAEGWSYDDVLPYFLKLEDNRNIDELDPGYHRTGGPMTAEKINYTPEIKNPLLEAMAAMGYEQVDINGRRQTGVYNLQATVRNQQRCSTFKAYLEPAKDRPNLDILTDAYARKILIDGKGRYRRAYGVEFDHSGVTHIVRARQEVILSAGAFRSPQLLMLSGIGPRNHLMKFNIPVVADLPVGKNLQDHSTSFLVYTVDETITPVIQKNLNPVNILEYTVSRRGPLTSPNLIVLMAFLDGLNTTRYSRDFPRQELYFGEYDVLDIKNNMNVEDELFERVFSPYIGKPAYICLSSLLQPYGRGEVTLNSTDPYDEPNINPNYFMDKRDLKNVVEGLKICNAIAKQPVMQQVRARPLETIYPACEQFVADEDKYLSCVAKQVVLSFYHYSGTTRMGRRDDFRSVVDTHLRVIGVEGLRVVDAGVMPIVTSGNTNVPTMMIAEKTYDMMKDNIMCPDARQIHRRYRWRYH